MYSELELARVWPDVGKNVSLKRGSVLIPGVLKAGTTVHANVRPAFCISHPINLVEYVLNLTPSC